MWISDFWYEKLPLLYAGAGIAALTLLGKAAAFSAMLMMGAGALTFWWRYRSRH